MKGSPKLIDLRLSVLDTDELDRLKKLKAALTKEKTDKAKKELANTEKLIEAEERRLKDDWAQGTPKFKKKVYYSVARGTQRPDHWLTWERYDPSNNYLEFRAAHVDGYRPVDPKEELYWAESVPPDKSGYYVNGDLILMQKKLLPYLEQRAEEIKLSQKLAENKIKEFNDMVDAAKAGVGDAIDKLANM